MKKYLLTLLLSSFVFTLVSCKNNAKKQTTQDILMSCIWEVTFNDESDEDKKEYRCEEYFSRDTVSLNIYYYGEKPYMPSKSLYYFSNTHDMEFDKSKVGKLTDGKYIIRRGSNNQTTGDRILKVSDKRIEFERNFHPGDNENLSYVLTFQSEKLPHLLDEFNNLEFRKNIY